VPPWLLLPWRASAPDGAPLSSVAPSVCYRSYSVDCRPFWHEEDVPKREKATACRRSRNLVSETLCCGVVLAVSKSPCRFISAHAYDDVTKQACALL
jgi:hypothetical protein